MILGAAEDKGELACAIGRLPGGGESRAGIEPRGGIASGGIEPGKLVESVRDLAFQLTVHPNTVARAYQELERRGIYSIQCNPAPTGALRKLRSKLRAKRSNTEPQPSHRRLYQHHRPDSDISVVLIVQQPAHAV